MRTAFLRKALEPGTCVLFSLSLSLSLSPPASVKRRTGRGEKLEEG